MKTFVLRFFPLLLVPLGDCGSGGMAPVSGTVTTDGKPLANAAIVFEPVDNKLSSQGSAGHTDSNGHFSLYVVLNKARISIRSGATTTPV